MYSILEIQSENILLRQICTYLNKPFSHHNHPDQYMTKDLHEYSKLYIHLIYIQHSYD